MSGLAATEDSSLHILINRDAVNSYGLTDLRGFELSGAYQSCQRTPAQARVTTSVGESEPLWCYLLRRSCVHLPLLRVFARLCAIIG
jgi:hypothetical protein